MKSNEVKNKTLSAAKWSSITEIASKIVSPIINMILARILAPEAFGILATVTMVISFAEVFVESGFQKFLIQHEFGSEIEEDQYTSVAFWTNFLFSIVIWLIIILLKNQIANIAGNRGLGNVIAIAGVMIPMFGVIGIQNSIIKKRLEFKKLFFVRVPSAIVPLIVTLPLALLGFDYWSLIIGNIIGVASRSFILVLIGGYKPKLYFNFIQLKHMLSFGVITLLDGLAIWATSWIDSLLIANFMNSYQLGLYKNSIATVTALFSIVSASITPVLYSSLSRLQNDDEVFVEVFYNTQKILCMFLLPIGFGVALYKDFITEFMFGKNWAEAGFIVGISAVTLSLRTIFVSFNSEAYRAKGKFYVPLILQIIDLLVLIPTCVISAQVGFETLVYARSIARLDLVVPGFILMNYFCKISVKNTIKNLYPSFISVTVMSIVAIVIGKLSSSILWTITSIFICIIVYFGTLCLFKKERVHIKLFFEKFLI